MIDIINYNKVNKKFLCFLYLTALSCLLFIVISIINSKKDMEFYKNTKQVNCLVTNKKSKDNENIIRVSYKISNKVYLSEIYVTNEEFDSIHIGDKVEIFYNKKRPSECRMNTRSVINLLVIVLLLVMTMIVCILIAIFYSIRIRTNRKLINDNNTIDAKFYRLEFKNSIFTNKRIYFVYCKAVLNNEKKVFKSIGFKDKPKPLNDTSKIKVYVDNNNHYLVNIYDLI